MMYNKILHASLPSVVKCNFLFGKLENRPDRRTCPRKVYGAIASQLLASEPTNRKRGIDTVWCLLVRC